MPRPKLTRRILAKAIPVATSIGGGAAITHAVAQEIGRRQGEAQKKVPKWARKIPGVRAGEIQGHLGRFLEETKGLYEQPETDRKILKQLIGGAAGGLVGTGVGGGAGALAAFIPRKPTYRRMQRSKLGGGLVGGLAGAYLGSRGGTPTKKLGRHGGLNKSSAQIPAAFAAQERALLYDGFWEGVQRKWNAGRRWLSEKAWPHASRQAALGTLGEVLTEFPGLPPMSVDAIPVRRRVADLKSQNLSNVQLRSIIERANQVIDQMPAGSPMRKAAEKSIGDSMLELQLRGSSI